MALTATPETAGLEQARRILDVAQESAEIWPGFVLQEAVLIGAIKPEGPVLLIGDEVPPDDYSSSVRGVHVRYGVPPDSLSYLRLNLDWNGERGVGTAMGFTDATLPYLAHFLIHEAFHTHQANVNRDDPDRFEHLPNPSFPDTSHLALSLLNLEGRYLGAALGEPDDRKALEFARSAVAVRSFRCRALPHDECARERGIERIEGSATYATSALLGETLGYGPDGVWQDSLAAALAVIDLDRLERWHFYDTGHVWLRLIARFFREREWQEQVEMQSPDEVLAMYMRDAYPDIESLLSGVHWDAARQVAHEVIEDQSARRREAEHSDEPDGVPFIVLFGNVASLTTEQERSPDGAVRRTLRFDGGTASFARRSDPFCCPVGERTVAAVAGAFAEVGGVEVPLDVPGNASGSILVELPAIQLQISSGRLDVFADSVVVRRLD